MNTQELVDMVKSGTVIEYDTVFQRKNVLEFFDSSDVEIGYNTQKYMNIDSELGRNTEYMYPGFNTDFGGIACYASIRGRPSVHYRDVADIVENPCLPKIDVRSDLEFAKDFAELMC